jgi:phage-related baseplate assembly protein
VPTLAELLNPRTRQQWRDALLADLRAAGFNVSLAPSGDNRRNVTEMIAAGFAKVDETIGKVAAGGLLDTAFGGWLRLRMDSGYDLPAKPATMTVGTVRLTCASTAGPYTIAPGAVWVGREAIGAVPARRYQNTTGGELAPGGFLDVQVSAEFPGAAWNLGNGQIRTVFTGLPGVSVDNPAVGITGTWVTTPGTDDEVDATPDAAKQRARDRWGTLGRGANDAAYRYIATTASAEVTRVRVYPGPGDGTLELILAGATGTVSSGAVAAAEAAVDAAKPVTDDPTVRAAALTTVTPTGTVYVRSAQLAAAQAAADAARLALLASLDIGGTLDLGAIYAVLRQPGVTDVDLVTPAGDTAVAYDAVAGLDLSSLTWLAV